MLKDIFFEEISNYLALPGGFVWVALLGAELAEPENMRKEFDLHVLAVEDNALNERNIDCSLFDFLFSQMFVFLPKFIKAQLQFIDLLFQSVDSFPIRDFGFDLVTFCC